MKIPENWKLEIENFGKLNDLEVLDTLCEDVVGAKKGANSHLQSTANIAVCRHHFLARAAILGRITYLLSTTEDSWYDVSSTILG